MNIVLSALCRGLCKSVVLVGSASWLLATGAIAQVQQGGGSDTNPQNALNWQALPPIYDGYDTAYRAEYELINNAWVIVGASYYRNWTDRVWHRNGVPMGNIEFAFPFSTGVPGTGVSYTSQGTVTHRMQWISASPAPTQVRVIINSSTSALGRAMGTCEVNNGLNSPIVEENDGYGIERFQYGKKAFVVSVSGGIATKSHYTNAAGAGAPTSQILYPQTYASAGGVTMAIDNRQALIIQAGAGGHYHSEPAAPVNRILAHNVLNPAYTWSRALNIATPPSNLWQTINYPFTTPGVNRVLSETFYGSPVSNSATWHYGFPVAQQTYFVTLWQSNYLDPPSIDPFQIQLIGAATTESTPTESYSFSGLGNSVSGSLPHNGNYNIQDLWSQNYIKCLQYMEVWKTDPVDPHKITKSNTTHYTSAVPTGSHDVNLEYTYSDGSVSTSKRTYIFHADLEHYDQPSHAKVDWRIGHPFESLPFKTGGYELDTAQQGTLDIPGTTQFDYVGAAKTVGSVIKVLSAFPALQGPGKIAAAVAAAFEIGFEMYGPEPPVDYTARHTDDYPATYAYDGGIHHTMKGGTAIGDYKWRVEHRPRKQVTPGYDDTWNASGFNRRDNIWMHAGESGTTSPKVIRFRHAGGTFGGGGPGTGGPGGVGGGGT